MQKHKGYGHFAIQHVDKYGSVLYEEPFQHNSLAHQGEEIMLDVFFRGAASPTKFMMALANGTVNDDTTGTTLPSEPSGNGYSRIELPRSNAGFVKLEKNSTNNNFVITTKDCTFTATGGNIGPVNTAIILAEHSGVTKLIAYRELSQTRMMNDGESLVVTYKLELD